MLKFEIFYFGLKEGTNKQQSINDLAKLLCISDEAAEKIINNTFSILSSGLVEQKANQYFESFEKAGLKVEIRECSIDKNGFSTMPPPDYQSKYTESLSENSEQSLNVLFKGKGSDYFKIWIVNIFLTIITLSIYSAWAKVRNNQYFYGNTFIDGSSFRYTAKPLTILKGRLIALAFFAIYSLINQFNLFLGFIIFLILMLFLPWIIVRALQFNARNSLFRNVRFNFDAKAKDAAIVFLLWPILVPFTLGLIMPYLWYKQSQFFVNHSKFGTSSFAFSASGKDYYRIFLNILLVIIALAVVSSVAISYLGVANSAAMMDTILPFMAPLMMLLYLFIFAYSAAALGNLLFNATTIQNHSFTASLKTKQMAWLYFSNTLGILLTLGLFIPWAQVRMAKYRSECLSLQITGSLDHFINAEQQKVSALGEQMGEVFDMDVSIL